MSASTPPTSGSPINDLNPDSEAMTHARLERLLFSLTPSAPSPELRDRVAHDLALAEKFRTLEPAVLEAVTTPSSKPAIQPLTWATFGAAAAVVIMSAMQWAHFRGREAGGFADSAKPAAHRLTTEIPEISNSREFLKVNDDGINFSQSSGLPERRLRVKTIERQQWVDPRDGAVYIIETPREHTVAVPVNIQ